MTQTPDWHSIPGAPAPGMRLCSRDDIPDGGARLLAIVEGAPIFDTVPPRTFSVVLTREGESLRGWVNRCAHFGVPLAQKQSQLIFRSGQSISCNVHYARYHWEDGRCLSDECEGEGLIALPLHIGPDGSIRVPGDPA